MTWVFGSTKEETQSKLKEIEVETEEEIKQAKKTLNQEVQMIVDLLKIFIEFEKALDSFSHLPTQENFILLENCVNSIEPRIKELQRENIETEHFFKAIDHNFEYTKRYVEKVHKLL